jgi:hypothetical protein
MIGTTNRQPDEVMRDHQDVLRAYAQQVVAHGEPLTPSQETDKTARMQVYLALGESMHLTVPEMVTLLYKEVLVEDKRCDCHSCKGRAANQT